VNNEFAGIICAEYEYLYGHKSVYIMEELLLAQFRGKGYAKIMQQLFHKALGEDIKYVFGHILAENIPSFKTALACGRKVLEKEIFFPF
jgi:RimJ/RimL family protein N-acetyltransferase